MTLRKRRAPPRKRRASAGQPALPAAAPRTVALSMEPSVKSRFCAAAVRTRTWPGQKSRGRRTTRGGDLRSWRTVTARTRRRIMTPLRQAAAPRSRTGWPGCSAGASGSESVRRRHKSGSSGRQVCACRSHPRACSRAFALAPAARHRPGSFPARLRVSAHDGPAHCPL